MLSVKAAEQLVQALLLKLLNNFIDYNLLTPENYAFSGVCLFFKNFIYMRFD